MEKAKLDWKTFTARRRLDIYAWLKSKNIKGYAELMTWCASKDMTGPEKDDVKAFFAPPKKKVEAVKEISTVASEMAELLEAAAQASAETKKLDPEAWADLIVSGDEVASPVLEKAAPTKVRKGRTKKKVDIVE